MATNIIESTIEEPHTIPAFCIIINRPFHAPFSRQPLTSQVWTTTMTHAKVISQLSLPHTTHSPVGKQPNTKITSLVLSLKCSSLRQCSFWSVFMCSLLLVYTYTYACEPTNSLHPQYTDYVMMSKKNTGMLAAFIFTSSSTYMGNQACTFMAHRHTDRHTHTETDTHVHSRTC